MDPPPAPGEPIAMEVRRVICSFAYVLLFAVTFDIAVAFSTFQTGKEENAVAKSGILRAMQQDIRQAFRREEALHEEHLQTGDGSQGRHARAPADQA